MRNKDYIDDKLVFSFINSEECLNYKKLNEFLIRNDLPLLERWAFYFLGKTYFIDKEAIENIW